MKLRDYIRENADREIIDIEALEKCLAKPRPKTIYDIKCGDPYFVLVSNGNIVKQIWNDYGSEKVSRSMGFAFLTEEEAEIRKKILMIEEELIRLGGRREFKVSGHNHCINPYFEERKLSHYFVGNEVYFDTEEQAEEAVEQIGEQRIIDEYLKPRLIFDEV